MAKSKEVDDFRKSVEDAKGSSGNAWKPDAGETLFGKVLSIRRVANSKYGQDQRVASIQEEDTGKTVLVFLSTVLESQFSANNIAEGDRVGIKYLGTPEGKQYKDYVVMVQREKNPFENE